MSKTGLIATVVAVGIAGLCIFPPNRKPTVTQTAAPVVQEVPKIEFAAPEPDPDVPAVPPPASPLPPFEEVRVQVKPPAPTVPAKAEVVTVTRPAPSERELMCKVVEKRRAVALHDLESANKEIALKMKQRQVVLDELTDVRQAELDMKARYDRHNFIEWERVYYKNFRYRSHDNESLRSLDNASAAIATRRAKAEASLRAIDAALETLRTKRDDAERRTR